MNNTKRLAYGGLLAALIMVATAYLKFPTTLGYIHIGDGIIYLSAAILGPFAGLVAAVGSCLADLLAGYVTYAPITFIIMGLVAGYLLQKKTRSVAYSALLLLLLQAFMVLGYFLFEAILYGMPAALPSAGFNCIQGIAGVAIGLAAILFTQKLMPKK